jgi:hypothetical protein
MIFPYVCDMCSNTKWSIKYNSEKKYNMITCSGCQQSVVLESIFGGRKVAEEIKKTNPAKTGSVVGDGKVE